jgi:hypothetical protein
VLVYQVLADRPEERRREWIALLWQHEQRTIADLRALQPAQWDRLQLPIGAERVLQQAIALPNTALALPPPPQPPASPRTGVAATTANAVEAPAGAAPGAIGPKKLEEDFKGGLLKLSRSITAAASGIGKRNSSN